MGAFSSSSALLQVVRLCQSTLDLTTQNPTAMIKSRRLATSLNGSGTGSLMSVRRCLVPRDFVGSKFLPQWSTYREVSGGHGTSRFLINWSPSALAAETQSRVPDLTPTLDLAKPFTICQRTFIHSVLNFILVGVIVLINVFHIFVSNAPQPCSYCWHV